MQPGTMKVRFVKAAIAQTRVGRTLPSGSLRAGSVRRADLLLVSLSSLADVLRVGSQRKDHGQLDRSNRKGPIA
jgi:hypothetical protein